MPELSYVLPIKWSGEQDLAEMAAYLRSISDVAEVLVVDGSDPDAFARHAQAFASIRHVPTDPRFRFRNGKVNNVLTGIELARHERVVIADDDVRYEPEALRRLATELDEADLVIPQNYFAPMPWHAIWDTGRTLLNRSIAHDFPGTLGVRRSMVLACGGYDGDVLFENLELMRTVGVAGGRIRHVLDLYVRRVPPSARTFWNQRIRQAYDEFARPRVLAMWLAVGPAVGLLVVTGRWELLGVAAIGVITLAEIGRRRAGGCAHFPARASVAAPVWVLERATCSWLAVAARLRGGVRYAGGRITRAASPVRTLRLRVSDQGNARVRNAIT